MAAQKPVYAENPTTGERFQLVNNEWVALSKPKGMGITQEDFDTAKSIVDDTRAYANRVGGLTSGAIGAGTAKLPGSHAYNLDKDIESIQSRISFDKLAQMKAMSPTGASSLGSLTEGERRALGNAIASLDIGQGEDQLKNNFGRVKQVTQNAVPGTTTSVPIDLSAGYSRKLIPRGAFYKDKEGNIRKNDNLDAGNPIVVPVGGVQPSKRAVANQALKAKSNGGWKVVEVKD